MEKFAHKYRIPSARWANWDYSKNAAYFVTICTAHFTHDFGEIAVQTQNLASRSGRTQNLASGLKQTQNLASLLIATPLGQEAINCWAEIPAHFPFVVVDGFGVMPNHVHGIIIIDKPDDGAG